MSWKYQKEEARNFNFKKIIKELDQTINNFSFKISKKCNLPKEDIKQKILIKVFNSIDKFDKSKSAMNTFFYGIIRNYSLDILRSEMRRLKYECDVELICIKDQHSESEIKEYLKDFIGRFDDRSNNIFEKLLNGYKIKDIAEDLNLSQSIIYNIITRKIRPELVKNFC